MKLLNALVSETFNPSDFDIAECAELLAKNPMYGGLTQGCFYSHAQHNVRVSKALEKAGESVELQLYALLHNIPQTLVTDHYRFTNLNDTKTIQAIQHWMMQAVNLPAITGHQQAHITWAVSLIQKAEARDFLPPALAPFFKHLAKSSERPAKAQPWPKAADNFVQRYRDLQSARGVNNA